MTGLRECEETWCDSAFLAVLFFSVKVAVACRMPALMLCEDIYRYDKSWRRHLDPTMLPVTLRHMRDARARMAARRCSGHVLRACCSSGRGVSRAKEREFG